MKKSAPGGIPDSGRNRTGSILTGSAKSGRRTAIASPTAGPGPVMAQEEDGSRALCWE